MPTNSIDFRALKSAFEAHEFFLVYQPIVTIVDGRCFGAEALIRWRRGGSDVLDAAEFISVTDRTPLSGRITYWVIDTVAMELGSWLASNENANVSINVPAEILGRGGLAYAAAKSGLRAYAKQVILEITESGVPDQLGLDALNSIGTTGARVALDDTTLSGSNLALLTRCHFDFIKIDRTLVAELAPDKPQPKWLHGLTSLLQTTTLQIIAEGVETDYQVDALRMAGVQLVQGHYFSAPRIAKDFKRFYEETR